MSRNKFKFRRQIIAAGGIDSTAGFEFDAASTMNGVLTFSAAPVFNVNPTFTYGIKEPVQLLDDSDSLSDASTGGTAILGYGITAITVTGTTGSSTAGSTHNDLVFKLNTPYAAGINKEIYITGTSASTKVVSIRTATSTQTFFGTTRNSFSFTTTVNDLLGGFGVKLRGITTSQWAVVMPGKLSTAETLAGATA